MVNRLFFSANRREDAGYDPLNSEIYELNLERKNIKTITTRQGPDNSPVISPDGNQIAYIGFDDNLDGYQVRKLYVMDRDGSNSKLISGKLDRDVSNISWMENGKGVFFQYDDQGNTKIAAIDLQGKVTNLTDHVGGLSLGRPYGAGTFSITSFWEICLYSLRTRPPC